MQANAQLGAPLVFMPESIQFCPNTEVHFHADSILKGTPPYQYRWLLDNETIGSNENLLIQLNDTAEITLMVMDVNGMIGRETTQALPYEAIDASFSTDYHQGCSPLTISFTSNCVAFQYIASMDWIFGTTDSVSQMASVVYEYSAPGLYHPQLKITDLHGCVWTDTSTVPIRIFPTPIARFRMEESRIYLPENELNVENLSTGANHFIWHYSGGLPIEGQAPTIELPADVEGVYELELTAMNAFGCSHSTSKQAEVIQAIELFIPNSFTPNGDGINDTWKIEGPGMDTYHMHLEIYDYWGTLVLSTDNSELAWTGFSAETGIPLNSGNYSYRIIARDTEHGVGHLFEGHVILLH
jgi:gliding motility-associated-like protein